MARLGESFVVKQLTHEGDAKLASILFTGIPNTTLSAVACKDLIEKYIVVKGNLPKNANQHDSASKCEKWRLNDDSNKIKMALGVLERHVNVPDIVCRESPQKAVFANAAFKAGDLMLLPTTTTVKTVEKSKKGEVNSIFLCTGGVSKNHAFFLNAPHDFVSPAFYVTDTDKEREANMKIMMVNVELVGKFAFEGKRSTSEHCHIQIPCLVNYKNLEIGGELMYYQKAHEKDKKGTKRPFDVV